MTAVALAGILGHGNIDRLIRFRNGGLFVHSSTKQQLHHVDLASGRVDYAMPLDAGAFDVVNTGGVTVARNRQTGAATVIDLSDATGKASRALLMDKGADLLSGGGQVYAIDRAGGTATPIDTSGATVGAPARLGAPIEGVAAVDDDGRLWAPVPSRGEIVPIGTQRQGGRTVGLPLAPARVTDAGGRLDVTVFNRSPFGVAHQGGETVISRLRVGVADRPLTYRGHLDFAALQGDVGGNHLAGLDRANGAVVRIERETGQAVAIPVPGRSAQALSPPLQAGNKLILADPQRGEVIVIDVDRPGSHSVVAVVEGGGALDVQVKDGSVLVNAPDGAKAVQVDQDGRVQTIDKYVPVPMPADPSKPPQQAPRPSVRPQPVKPVNTGRGPQVPTVTAAPKAPGPPVNLAATAGKSQVTLTWQPPPNGAATLTGYVITGPRGDDPVPSGTLTATLPADNEVPVAFRIRAVNAVGPGAPAIFPSVTPHSQVPGKVGSIRPMAGDQKVDLTWSPAAANGTTIARYVITGSDGSTTSRPGSVTSTTVDKLMNGASYTFTVQAVATNGAAGDASSPSAAMVPFGPPTAPSGFSVVAQDGALRVTFTPAEKDGNGRPVDGYEAVAAAGDLRDPPSGRSPTSGDSSPIELPELPNGTAHSVWIRTVTGDAGPGPWSERKLATPAGVPTVELNDVQAAGERQLTGTFTVTDNGAAARCVLVVGSIEKAVESCSGRVSITIDGLEHSRSYDVYAYASNSAGRSGNSRTIPGTTKPQPCRSWSGFAQNQWPPQGAAIRDAPAGRVVGGLAGNTPITFDRWTNAGAAPYPGNPSPYNSNEWLHLADGRGWVSYAGTRAVTMSYDASASGPGGPAVPLPPECRS